MKNLVILDGNALIHRAYHALPPFKTKKGQLVNAIYGFISVLFRVIKELKPDYLAATFDLAGPTFRDLEYDQYKAKRVKAPQDLYDQIPLVKEFVKTLNIPIYEKSGFEADDAIGTIVSQAASHRPPVRSIIVTGDLDTLQLIDKNTEVYNLKKGVNSVAVYNIKAVEKRYGLKPKQIVDFKALKGDPSDNIPGVLGVGEKTAVELVKRFGSLKKLYADLSKSNLNPKLKARLLEYKKDAFFSYRLASIRKDVPMKFNLSDAKWGEYDRDKVIKFLGKMEFKSLTKRFLDYDKI
ncbi:MAG: hypothetical protein CO003_01910 [Candidatus Portnoybacteria bacterium CG_4_8_14_3_um_filter_44_15]|uniref:5'-3' exonuclease domain-containing protein n=3 Tax=Candidatus Portnoyibacteriota TaxID=1817913 RepID=A0A2M7IDK3_9BACT|nr:MAG: hypothetical protein COX45_00300 [Candidatus Portnoybacteria bacterium CG23_combo_of_CG06-09_8_20_14_all_44_36]PIW74581.1 MAG: hypothetical protein CO003_01910 [Candidatus Portnoybacteria bacterium CG_4_8_14_3_um_filter_44_15]PIZ69645.1 MAG: hypothetical protein COY10_01105 [Candidatus Portnoybacteria bacterium CG_4_10_14_0_2_um_filter_43_36]